jgi:hypothetical protein
MLLAVPQLQENCSNAMQTYDQMIQEGRRLVAMIQEKAAEAQDRAQEMIQQAREKQAEMRRRAESMKSESIARANDRQQAATSTQEGLRAQMVQRAMNRSNTPMDILNASFVDAQNRTSSLEAPPATAPDTTELIGSFVATLQLVMEIMYGAVLGIQNVRSHVSCLSYHISYLMSHVFDGRYRC